MNTPGRLEMAVRLVRGGFHSVALPQELESTLGLDRAVVDSALREVSHQLTWNRPNDAWLYAIVRAMRPRLVVETGVDQGNSSSAILRALDRNETGRLVSIDRPFDTPLNGDGRVDLSGRGRVGAEVPPGLRRRWTLIAGDAKAHLERVLKSEGPVDIFFHDSDHSYNHQSWEYEMAWPYIRPGGLLLSDDVDWTTAFKNFSTRRGIQPYIFRLGPSVRGALWKAV
ncbi:MAG: class I SAM-dependent methyltransferase [Euryarchaeota archaeon]|nr:class I SAM-dependent methyltransferase [Euryarchaeota archaeon]MDE1879535.1 class I SAM-dependent methyltransferase [Euryarchaeota archaeon]